MVFTDRGIGLAVRRRKKVKENIKMTGRMQRKLVLVFALVLIMLVGLNIRLIYINAASGDKYTKKVLSQMGYASTTIPYKRGSILDANGETLASSEKVYHVILDCSVLSSLSGSDEKIEKVQTTTMQTLASYFEDLSEDDLWAYFEENPSSSYKRLLKNISYEEMQGFQDLMDEDSNIQGVWFEETYIRTYPNDYLASALIGFTTTNDEDEEVGSLGIEEYYNDELTGIAGRTYGYLNDDSTVETTTQATVDGNNVVLNIDINIQKIVEKYVTEFNEEHRNEASEGLGSKHTAVIVMDPNTGAVLAMCSYPYYNLNDPTDLTYLSQYTEEEVEAMSNEEVSEARNDMWRNFCISDTYEPGSTFKPITVSMGLETGVLSGSEYYYCDGYEVINGTTVKCSHTSGHGSITFNEAISLSCNDALMQMSYLIGAENFVKYQAIYGFGKKTGIDLQGEVNAAGLLFTVDNMDSLDLAVNSFGQNFNVTMIQMMAGFCALVNGGYYYQPQVAARIENTDGDVVTEFEPKLLKQIVSEETSEIICEALLETVESGTAVSAQVEGYSVGGKTGTAEKFPRGEGTYLVSFMGCVPADDPEVCFYVVIDEPNVESQADSKLAVTLCQNIMSEVLPYLNVTTTAEEEGTEEEVEIDWSVGSDETWDNDESFSDEDISYPETEESDYYTTGDTAYSGDDESYGNEGE